MDKELLIGDSVNMPELSHFGCDLVAVFPYPVLLLDETLKIESVSAAFCDHFNVKHDMIVGRALASLPLGWNIAALAEGLHNLITFRNQTDARTFQCESAQGDGTVLKFQARYLEGAYGKLSVVLTVEDLTTHRKTEHDLHASEGLLELAADAACIGMWDNNVVTGARKWDARCCALFGVTGPDIPTYDELMARIHPDDRDILDRAVKKALAGHSGGYLSHEYRVYRFNDNAERWIHVTGRAYFDENGQALRIIGIIQDITDRKQDEAELRESERQFRSMANMLPQIIWVARADGRHEYFNRRWYEATGVPEGKTDSLMWNAQYHPDDRARAWELWQSSLKTGAPYEIEYRLRQGDGSYRWTLGRALPQRDAQGRILRWFGTCTDIEDRKQREYLQAQALQHAESASVAKSEFLANMSHEIRTPMNAVLGLANILEKTDPLSAQQQGYITTLKKSAASLLNLINDLLDISKIETHAIELENIAFSPVQAVEEVLEILSLPAHDKNIDLSADMGALEGRFYLGDPNRLRQVLMNLCSNALKFTHTGSIQITASATPVTGKPGTEQIIISVTDTGIGIPAHKHEEIFQKFVQADSSICRKYGGTGLGLPIAKTLMELMGGDITLRSEEGKGAVFTVSVPLQRADAEAVIDRYAISPHTPVFELETRAERVLLVEDYEPNILVTTIFLEDFGYEHDVARNGIEAVEKVMNNGYAALLMDVQMPGMDGLETTRIIRKHEKDNHLPRVPIIGMTAHALATDRTRCLEAGMDAYIAKPFDPNKLREKLVETIKAASLQKPDIARLH